MATANDPIEFTGVGSLHYYEWLAHLWDLHITRGHEHDSNKDFASIRFAARLLGIGTSIQAASRLADKIGRYAHQWQAHKPGSQPTASLLDTLDDMASYAGILRVLLEEEAVEMGDKETVAPMTTGRAVYHRKYTHLKGEER